MKMTQEQKDKRKETTLRNLKDRVNWFMGNIIDNLGPWDSKSSGLLEFMKSWIDEDGWTHVDDDHEELD